MAPRPCRRAGTWERTSENSNKNLLLLSTRIITRRHSRRRRAIPFLFASNSLFLLLPSSPSSQVAVAVAAFSPVRLKNQNHYHHRQPSLWRGRQNIWLSEPAPVLSTTTVGSNSNGSLETTSTAASSAKEKQQQQGKDSIQQFRNDVNKVIYELRGSDDDPTIPALYRSRRPNFSSIWYPEDWKIHTSRRRYLRYMIQFPTSRLLRRTLPHMMILLIWSMIAVALCKPTNAMVARLHLGLTSMSLVSTFIAALLMMRSNESLKRLGEARNTFGRVILETREMGQLIGSGIYPKQPQAGLLAARHVSLFCWSLQAHVRCTNNNDVVSTLLPSRVDADYIINSDYKKKPPAAILMRLRQIFDDLSDNNILNKETEKALTQAIYRLNEALMITERVQHSPIPPLYTAHTTRLLLFYLLCLPIALYETLHNAFATVVVTLVAGYAMLGLDEISHLLELPFKLMPLRQLSKMAMVDSADAIFNQPPPLTYYNNNENDAAGSAE